MKKVIFSKHQSEQVDYLGVRQQVESKKADATEVSTVCADSNQYQLCWLTC